MHPGVAIALSRPVVRRALRYAVIVGVLLIAINHGGAILHGDVTTARLLRMALTAMVPYVVSTLSSVEVAWTRHHSPGGLAEPEARRATYPARPRSPNHGS